MKEGISFFFCNVSNSDCYEQLTLILFQIHGIMFRSRETVQRIILLSSLSVFNSIRPYRYHKIGNNFFYSPKHINHEMYMFFQNICRRTFNL